MKIPEVKAIPVWYEPTDEYHALFGLGKKKGTMVHAREGWFANLSLFTRLARRGVYSALMLASLITCAHFSISACKICFRRSGVLPAASSPWAAKLA